MIVKSGALDSGERECFFLQKLAAHDSCYGCFPKAYALAKTELQSKGLYHTTCYIEHIVGEDLLARLQHVGDSRAGKIAAVLSILKSVRAMELAGVVHRDLIAENILFRDDGTAVKSPFRTRRSVMHSWCT